MGEEGYGRHKWIEVNTTDGIIIADPTDVINHSIDLSNCKSGMSTNGFLYFPNDKNYSGTRINKLKSDKETIKAINYSKKLIKNIDVNIGYSTKKGYHGDTIKKANTLFKSNTPKNISAKVNELFNIEIPQGMDGYETCAYFNQISRLMLGDDLKDIGLNISVGARKLEAIGGYDGVTTIMYTPKEGNGLFKGLLYSKDTGIQRFDNLMAMAKYEDIIKLEVL